MPPLTAPDLASPRFKADPYPFYARLRAEAPVSPTRLPLFGPAWLVTRYDDVLAVLKDERFASDWSPKMPWVLLRFARPLTRSMLDRDPPDHTRLRTLVHKAFTPRLVERLRGRVEQLSHALLDASLARGAADLVRDYALPLPITIIADLLGIPAADRPRFYRHTTRLVSAATVADVALALPSVWTLQRYLGRLFAARRREPRDDMVTALVQAEDAGDRLDEDELLAMVILLLLGGYETTTHLIAGGVLALMQHPEQHGCLLDGPERAGVALEELLRHLSPLDIASVRLVREATAVSGVAIPPGALVLPVIGSANHDETRFPDPERLDLTRQPNRHLAFGQGAHFCLGAPLARLEGGIALRVLFERYPALRPAVPVEQLRWRRGLILRGLAGLPVEVG